MVVVTKGKERGKRGRVKRLLKNGRVEVERVNMVKRHTRPSQQNPQGGIIEKEGSLALPNVSPWCESCSKPARVKMVQDDSGNKERACHRCGTVITRAA
jgi:large subunit ribosomal protein L24